MVEGDGRGRDAGPDFRQPGMKGRDSRAICDGSGSNCGGTAPGRVQRNVRRSGRREPRPPPAPSPRCPWECHRGPARPAASGHRRRPDGRRPTPCLDRGQDRGTVEILAVVVLGTGFRRRPFADQHGMGRQINVPAGDARRIVPLHDGLAVDQQPGRRGGGTRDRCQAIGWNRAARSVPAAQLNGMVTPGGMIGSGLPPPTSRSEDGVGVPAMDPA